VRAFDATRSAVDANFFGRNQRQPDADNARLSQESHRLLQAKMDHDDLWLLKGQHSEGLWQFCLETELARRPAGSCVANHWLHGDMFFACTVDDVSRRSACPYARTKRRGLVSLQRKLVLYKL
jgi:hypothetical protein